MDFTISGQRMSLDADGVRRAVKGVIPTAVRSHVVDVEGVEYPVKQVFAAATGLDLLDFTTNQARRVLKTLGFSLRRIA